jgi:3-hydroxymyristoyl/3-hydroxydecanoyl-(acyl carrier protein) dehydratase
MLALVQAEPDIEIGEIHGAGATACEAEVEVPRDLPLFAGHFPGAPILPGATQLDSIVLRVVQLMWPELPALREIVRLKFMHPVRPGDRLRLRLDRNEARVTFELRRGEVACSAGTLVFA